MGATKTSPDRLIPVFDLRLTREDLDVVAHTLRSGWLTMGPRTLEFEAEFARSIGAAHAVAVSSCTAALHLAYLAAEVGPGDEVIVPSYTMAATAAAVLYAGGTPVFADIVSLERPVIDPAHVEALITPRTRAVVAVHFGGYAAAVDRLADLCARRGLVLIEDAAHSPMATLGIKPRDIRPGRRVQLLLEQGPGCRRGRAPGHRRFRGGGVCPLPGAAMP